MKTELRALLVGAAGRMGEAITASAGEVKIIPSELGNDIAAAISDCDVAIDFSHADATEALCAAATKCGKPLVIGTTGHSQKQLEIIHAAASKIPIVFASNFSVGVNALFALTQRAAALLGDDFDIEVTEAHHRMKKDAPSGTAKTLLQILKESRTGADLIHGREGNVGARAQKEIGVHSIRGGDIVGDHTVIFAGSGERLELTHKASSRETFARGALRAAHWVIDRDPGLYDMRDVLGLK